MDVARHAWQKLVPSLAVALLLVAVAAPVQAQPSPDATDDAALQREAFLDPLTSLLNRRGFFASAANELRNASDRAGVALSLISTAMANWTGS